MRRAGPALGVVLGIFIACAALLAWPRLHHEGEARASAPRPLAASGSVVADDAGPLREILMHYVPELEPTFAAAYRDFLGTLPHETRLVIVLRRGARARWGSFAERVDPSGALAARTRIIELDEPLGIWSKDRALVLAPPPNASDRRIELVIPPRPKPGEGSRPGDWDIIPAVAKAMPDSFTLRPLPIAFDAGDFAISGRRVLFDVNLFARNRGRGFRSPEELRERMTSLIGRDVVMLGSEPGDVPRHHMSMYMALTGDGAALVGDPEAGARIVGRDYAPGEVSAETGEPLRADFSPETVARFERAAADLRAAGFRVVRIPTVPFDDKTYFAYTNGVYETRAGKKIAWMPRFDVPALDDAARAVYESAGFSVLPVSVRALYTQHGTIGCLVNVLSRAE